MRGRLCDETCLSNERLCPSEDVTPHQRLRAELYAADVGFREVGGLRPQTRMRVVRRERSVSLRPKQNSSAMVMQRHRLVARGNDPSRGYCMSPLTGFAEVGGLRPPSPTAVVSVTGC
jgi:hypothetical protein